jgi:hypothetical protein
MYNYFSTKNAFGVLYVVVLMNLSLSDMHFSFFTGSQRSIATPLPFFIIKYCMKHLFLTCLPYETVITGNDQSKRRRYGEMTDGANNQYKMKDKYCRRVKQF